jgi:hypothetical protein
VRLTAALLIARRMPKLPEVHQVVNLPAHEAEVHHQVVVPKNEAGAETKPPVLTNLNYYT